MVEERNTGAPHDDPEALKAVHLNLHHVHRFLQHTLHRLSVLDNARDGVLFVDMQGVVLYANPYFLRMVGLPDGTNLSGAPLSNSMWGNPEAFRQMLRDVNEFGFVHNHALTLQDHSGQPIDVICSSVASHAEDGKLMGVEIMLYQATSRSKAPTDLVRQNALLEAVLAGTPYPVLVLDHALLLLRANDAALALFGNAENAKDLVTLRTLFANGHLSPDAIDALIMLLERHHGFSMDIEIGKSSFIVRAAPIEDSPARWVIIFNDISNLKALDTLKTQMLRMASHDLKSPLSLIIGYTDLLKESATEEQRPLLSGIQYATSRMNAIISDLLDLDRLRAGMLALETLELTSFTAALVTEYQPQVAKKSLSLILHQPLHELTIEADAAQLREALRNLLDNAIKYTPENGSIHLALTTERNDKGIVDAVRFSVTDTGCGIPEAALPHLFQPFFRVRTRETFNIPGTGLGLSLVKSVVESHHGKVWVESTDGQGSTFYMSLPLVQPTSSDLPS